MPAIHGRSNKKHLEAMMGLPDIFAICSILACQFANLSASWASSAEDRRFKQEAISKAAALAKLIRHNVETIEVNSAGTRLIGYAMRRGPDYRFNVAVVPFTLTGVDGGNTEQEYAASFVTPLNGPFTNDMLRSLHLPKVSASLLSFVEIDRTIWGGLDWRKSVQDGSGLTVPAHMYGCYKYRCCSNELGSIRIEISDGPFNPRMTIENRVNPLYDFASCGFADHQPAP